MAIAKKHPAQNATAQFKAFAHGNRRIVSLDDRYRAKIDNRIRSNPPQVHCKRDRLQHEIIAISVDDYPGQAILSLGLRQSFNPPLVVPGILPLAIRFEEIRSRSPAA
jgi:hypothetical protein